MARRVHGMEGDSVGPYALVTPSHAKLRVGFWLPDSVSVSLC